MGEGMTSGQGQAILFVLSGIFAVLLFGREHVQQSLSQLPWIAAILAVVACIVWVLWITLQSIAKVQQKIAGFYAKGGAVFSIFVITCAVLAVLFVSADAYIYSFDRQRPFFAALLGHRYAVMAFLFLIAAGFCYVLEVGIRALAARGRNVREREERLTPPTT